MSKKYVTISVPDELHAKISADSKHHGSLINSIADKYKDKKVCEACGSLCDVGKMMEKPCG